jgi:hypothetical protein
MCKFVGLNDQPVGSSRRFRRYLQAFDPDLEFVFLSDGHKWRPHMTLGPRNKIIQKDAR